MKVLELAVDAGPYTFVLVAVLFGRKWMVKKQRGPMFLEILDLTALTTQS